MKKGTKQQRLRTVEISTSILFLRRLVSFTYVHLKPEFGTVKKGQKANVDVQFNPLAEFQLNKNQSFTLSIISGPMYNFYFEGKASKPGVELSFSSYDFGPSFVLKQPLPVKTILLLRNREKQAMSVQTLYQKTSHLDVGLAAGQVILPYQEQKIKQGKFNKKFEKNVLQIPIVFTPRDFIKYSQIVKFDVNGLHTIEVEIKGEGIPFKLELLKTEQQNLDFGIVKVNDTIIKTITLINNSKKSILISFDLVQQINELKKLNLSISERGDILIMPRQKKEVEITFNPTTRQHSFKYQLHYKIVENQQKRKLLNITGVAHGIEVKLIEQNINFGTVVFNSKIMKQVQLSNLGDIGIKFGWEINQFAPILSIFPQKGFLTAHQDIIFEITFHPKMNISQKKQIQTKVKCNIQGSDPLFMSITGKCIPQPKESQQEIKFQTVVRTPKSHKIVIKNTSNKLWKIKATISTQSDIPKGYFSGKDQIQIPPSAQTEYQIIYFPLTMTSTPEFQEIKQDKHLATLFFPIPDGSALVYNLVGKSTPPGPLQTFDLVIKAKKQSYQMIPLKNWLKTTQRFQVTTSLQTEQPKKSIFMNGANTIDVTGESTKDYKLTIYGLKQTTNKAIVIFRNLITKEFVMFKINLVITAADPMNTIQMTSIVRQSVNKLITFENPLIEKVKIKKEMIIIEGDNLFVHPNQFEIKPKSQFGFQAIYRPLIVKQEQAKIIIKSDQLGQFIFPFKLTGIPTTSHRTLTFKTNLGSDNTQSFKFIHYGKKASIYQSKIQKLGVKKQNVDPKKGSIQSDFIVQTPNINAPAAETFEGNQINVNIKFEPSSLNQSNAQLIITSVDGGEYICMLNGYAYPPQPKGPFKIIGQKPPPIQFKNPFFESTEFNIRVDNPAISLSVKSPVKVEGKKVLNISASYKPVPGCSPNGRLILWTGDLPAWIFYLQGQ